MEHCQTDSAVFLFTILNDSQEPSLESLQLAALSWTSSFISLHSQKSASKRERKLIIYEADGICSGSQLKGSSTRLERQNDESRESGK